MLGVVLLCCSSSFYGLARGQTTTVVRPEQVHVATGETPDILRIQWTTICHIKSKCSPADYPGEDRVLYGTSSTALTSEVQASHYLVHLEMAENQTMHVAEIRGLPASTQIYYAVGGDMSSWSAVFSVKTGPDAVTLKDHLPMRFALIGDLGDYNGQSIPDIQRNVRKGGLDMLIHAGDFAYDLNSDSGRNGDEFMNDMEPVVANLPYMTCPGNHESGENFNQYTQRFQNMARTSGNITFPQFGTVRNNWYFSWNTGNVHFIALSTEIYFDDPALVRPQWEWFKADLIAASANRSSAPWLIVYGHRPVYCSCDGDCDDSAALVRRGPKQPNGTYAYGLDSLFYEYGVDLFIAGHEHDYERMYDIAPSENETSPWLSGKTTKSTHNPPATTHIVSGSAGNVEQHEPFQRPAPQRSAKRLNTYGWSRMDVYNDTHIHWQQIQTDNGQPSATWGTVVDDVWIVQQHHGPFHLHPRAAEPVSENQLREQDTVTEDVTSSAGYSGGPYKDWGCRKHHPLGRGQCTDKVAEKNLMQQGTWAYTKKQSTEVDVYV